MNKDWPTAQGQPNFLRKLYSSDTFSFENAFSEFSAQWPVWIYFRGLQKPESLLSFGLSLPQFWKLLIVSKIHLFEIFLYTLTVFYLYKISTLSSVLLEQFRSNSKVSGACCKTCLTETLLFFFKKMFFQQHWHFLPLPKPPHLFPLIYSSDYYFKYTNNNIDVSSVQSA